ncbi:MAG: hypothetical protein IPL47_04125 [Phyllobacteriaceae bacterium]|nr:hypothetical protein [Phyllobacteriaceae bacterium]
MSWLEDKPMRAVLALTAMALLAGCQVRPLYSGTDEAVKAGAPARIASVAVKTVSTREAQQVRNHLIFLLNGGAGEPADARWSVSLGVAASTTGALATQVATTDDYVPTASTVTMTSLYTIVDATSGETAASGKRQVTSSFDRPRQEFAAARAERDAQDRAARELAEQLRLAILQDLAKLGG